MKKFNHNEERCNEIDKNDNSDNKLRRKTTILKSLTNSIKTNVLNKEEELDKRKYSYSKEQDNKQEKCRNS